MANEITCSAPTGLTLTARLAQGATIGASITMAESGTLPGYYLGSVPGGTAAGRYVVTVLNGLVPVGSGELRWDGTAELVPSVPGDAMALTSGERTTTRGVIEASTILAKEATVTARPTLVQVEASSVLAKEATSAAIKAKTDPLPAAPAAVGDIPSAASIAAAVWAAGSRTLTSLGTVVVDTATAVWAAVTRTLTADPGASAHATTQAAIATADANAASRAVINLAEHDATQAAIAALPSAAGITAAVRADIERTGGMLDLVATKAETEAAIVAIGDPLARPVPGTYPAGSAGEALGKLVVGPPEEAATVIPGPPTETGVCRVYGYLETITNSKVLDNVKVEFTLTSPTGVAASERVIAHRTVVVTTDAQGRIQGPTGDPWVDLQRNDLLTPAGTGYTISSAALGVRGKPVTLTTQVADLRTLLLS